MLALPSCSQAHDHLLAVGREARREGHAGEIADQFALAGLELQQIDPRLAAVVGHVGDFLARRREPRRQHQVVAVGQVAQVGAVLVHDRQPLDAVVLRAALGDEDDAGVEIALLAGQPLVDRVGDDVGDAAPVLAVGEELLADQLLAGERVPQPEFGPQPAVGLRASTRPVTSAWALIDLPVLEARRDVGIGDLLDEGAPCRSARTGPSASGRRRSRRRSARRSRRPTGSR